MKLSESIEISLAHILYYPSKVTPEEHHAIKVCIEAAQRLQDVRNKHILYPHTKLKSETPE